MKKILIISIFISVYSNAVMANGSGEGPITFELVGYPITAQTSSVFFTTPPAYLTDTPACNTALRWVVDMSKPNGKDIYSFILAASISGKEIYVRGAGTCDVFSDSETVKWVKFRNQ